ncbi:MAG TPA: hypothetical protein VNU19_07965, partial [Candidatus Acidoferrum sp.]|nr:hypothetical protein [Candidatus Acidoferrum sp.]
MELETKQSQASRRDRGHTAIFTYADAEDSYTSQLNTGIGLASNEETAASYAKWFDAGAIEGIVSRVLYRQDGDDALSVKHVYLKPHRAVPRHKHNTDCLYVVTYGSLLMGNRELKPA